MYIKFTYQLNVNGIKCQDSKSQSIVLLYYDCPNVHTTYNTGTRTLHFYSSSIVFDLPKLYSSVLCTTSVLFFFKQSSSSKSFLLLNCFFCNPSRVHVVTQHSNTWTSLHQNTWSSNTWLPQLDSLISSSSSTYE